MNKKMKSQSGLRILKKDFECLKERIKMFYILNKKRDLNI